MRQKVNSIRGSVTFPLVNLLNLDKEKPIFNRCRPHFVTSMRRWTKIIFRREFLMSLATTNSIPSPKILMSQMKKTQGIFFNLVREKKRENSGSSLLHRFNKFEVGEKLGNFSI